MTAVAIGARRSLVRADLVGTVVLLRAALRRDRLRIAAWVGGLAVFTIGSAGSFVDTYPTAADRAAATTTMELPAMVALVGPNPSPADYTYGAMVTHQMTVMTAVIVGIMSVLLLVRHTRAEEESGRAELIRAGVVGQHAPLAAALGVVVAANAALWVVLTIGVGSLGVDSVTFSGSFLYGASLATVGLVFGGAAAVTAQLTEASRGASGIALAAVGAAYATRAVGDVGPGALSWLSPVHWAQQTGAYVDDRWWPLTLGLAATVVLLGVAVSIGARRDLGAGLSPPRPGPPRASRHLASPIGHAVRLQRASMIAWGAGMAALGMMYGSLLDSVEEMLAELEGIEDLLPSIEGAALSDQFTTMVLSVVAMISSIGAVLAVLRIRSEETSGRAEPVLATPVSRARWAGGHLVVALVGGTGLLAVAGLSFGVTGAVVTGEARLVGEGLGAALVNAPAVWCTVALALALIGLAPRAVEAVWIVVAHAFLVVYLGAYLPFPDWLEKLSPFGHVPRLPAADLNLTPVLVLTAIAAALIAAGFAGLRRRDITSTT